MALVERALLVYREKYHSTLQALLAFAEQQGAEVIQVPFGEFSGDPAPWLEKATHVVALVRDGDLPVLIRGAQHRDFSLGVVPGDAEAVAWSWFSLPRRDEELFALAFADDASPVDMAVCNNEVVLGMVMLGTTPFLDRRSKAYTRARTTLWARAWQWVLLFVASVRALFGLHPFPVTLTTGRDVTLKTAVTGIVVVENDVRGAAAKLVNASISAADGKISAVVIAPQSITEYLSFLFLAMTRRRASKKLPSAISYIKTDRLKITGQKTLTYFVDGIKREADEIEVHLLPKAVRLNLSEQFHEAHAAQAEQKDTMKVENLPEHEDRLAMIQKHLPFFTHAIEEDFKDLFLLLKDNARIRPDYIVLMVLSSLVAGLGLFLNSAAVIIGAMVLAPLMAPMISLSMGVLRNDTMLMRDSALCIGVGVVLALLASALVALVVPMQQMTPEIAARLQPSLLDLGVAIGSGIAGAYAHARESVMKSLPGVAIAVALVPPLCVAGIGLGWMDWQVIGGAMLLFITNLVGITLAGLLTFMVLGYAPVRRATQGLGWSLLIVVLVAIPLAVSFNNIRNHWQVENYLVSTPFMLEGMAVEFSDVQVKLRRGQMHVRADVSSARILSAADMGYLKRRLEHEFERQVELEVVTRLRL